MIRIASAFAAAPPDASRRPGEVDCWPGDLLARVPARWCVVHCLPRQEKRLADDLRRHGIGRALFLERRVRRYPGRGLQESLVPLLGGYLFVDAGEREREAVYATRRAVRILTVARPELLAQDLHRLAALLACAEEPLLVRPEIAAGDAVTLIAGVFAGCTGVVLRRRGCDELVVNIHALGTSVAVQLPAQTAQRLAT